MKFLTQAQYLAATATLTGLLSLPAFANHDIYSDQQIKKGKVIQVTPTYETVHVQRPQKSCWTETTYPNRQYDHGHRYRSINHAQYRNQHNDTAAPIIGAIIGGVIGNQFGKGNGKPVATVAGAVIGGSLANKAASHRIEKYNKGRYKHNKHRGKYKGAITKKVCRVSHQNVQTINELTGYDVSYRYQGKTYYTHTQNHPGEYINLAVQVTPIE
ncbi:glycine zipper 2TM domain-containing protein [Catenovulum adriaticum]|uniref:Glycine zipper 2TM domain-containing protein n=1 Tax=Catenovulum adriaticum TaxID=2984846 RepID=A0ABY7AR14_9ALTE|nr:glycine zipper 2TM domain-containing protein [Catenovulum sp. TS8]WAJ71116.1 glycine zipper 2TM domain-containing protein [Catenovulum sp. TS8]